MPESYTYTRTDNAVAYDGGPGSMSVTLISFFSLLTGVGSCAAFQAALKTGKVLDYSRE